MITQKTVNEILSKEKPTIIIFQSDYGIGCWYDNKTLLKKLKNKLSRKLIDLPQKYTNFRSKAI